MINEEKFNQVYERYSSLLIKFIWDRTGNREDSLEMCQDVFLAFSRYMDSVEEELWKAWLILAAKRKCIDYFRKSKTKNEMANVERVEREVVVENSAELVVERVVQSEFVYRILETLHRKNPKWYEAIEAVCICELTHEEAAEELQVSTEVLRSRIYRARKFLRSEFGEEYKNL
ncbi:MAG: sigma-70 family RNA polymerase sigma factor [Eubacteriales bacterium]|nr:sigma-70 family RNA polymerase sigma factor [Eubacteriales bacterium]